MQSESLFNYGYWRKDKEAEPGFSHELISSDSEMILHQTDLDTLEALPFPGIDTLYKAFKRNVQRIGNNDMLGTRVGSEYKWMTWKQVEDRCRYISFGINVLGLCPDITAEGQTYKFLGI
jgi:hypothetical protein